MQGVELNVNFPAWGIMHVARPVDALLAGSSQRPLPLAGRHVLALAMGAYLPHGAVLSRARVYIIPQRSVLAKQGTDLLHCGRGRPDASPVSYTHLTLPTTWNV